MQSGVGGKRRQRHGRNPCGTENGTLTTISAPHRYGPANFEPIKDDWDCAGSDKMSQDVCRLMTYLRGAQASQQLCACACAVN